MNKYRIRLEEWQEMINNENIINRYNEGEPFRILQLELIDKYNLNIQDKFSGRALGKAVKRCGYINLGKRNYVKSSEIDKPNNIIEKGVYYRYNKRYFKKCLENPRINKNSEDISLNINIVEELRDICDGLGIKSIERYIEAILLEFLEEINPADSRVEFAEESEAWSKEEIEFALGKEKEGHNLAVTLAMIGLYDLELNVTKEEFHKCYIEFSKV